MRILLASLVATLLAASPQALCQTLELDAPIAIKSITLIARPGEKLEGATIVIEKGRIVAAGAGVPIPSGAREFDGTGLFAYAGFIDGFNRTGLSAAKLTAEEERRVEGEATPVSDTPHVRTLEANRHGIFARRGVEDLLDIQEETFGDLRRAGFTAALIAPPQGIVGGSASCVLLGDRPLRHSVLNSAAMQTLSFEPPEQRTLRIRGNYPRTLLGTTAHLRQTLSDARWYRELLAAAGGDAASQAPFDRDLEALQPLIAGKVPAVFEVHDADEIDRALALSGEFGLRPILCGGRFAFRRVDAIKSAGVPVIVTMKVFRKPREFEIKPEELRKKPDDDTVFGREWEKRAFLPKSQYEEVKRQRDERLANPKLLDAAGVPWCFSTLELRDLDEALQGIEEFIKAGLPPESALRGLTTNAAKILGVERELGTVEVGKRGNLTILTSPLGEKDSAVRWVFVDGRDYEVKLPPSVERARERRKRDREEDEGVAPTGGRRKRDEAATQPLAAENAEKQPAAASKPAVVEKDAAPASKPAVAAEAGGAPQPLDDVVLHTPDWPIETDAQRQPAVRTGGSLLLKNAYVIPVAGDDLPSASILIQEGKIRAIGRDVAAPAGVKTIDLSGYCVMPGIIDPHAHIALDAVNEWTLSVTPEVRCADVVDSEDVNIHRALAGGVTTIHAMHGSANTIGGQNVILKLKYGRPAAELVVREANRTVKFALGENVKRPGIPAFVDGDNPRRFPGTRMGVEATVRRAFSQAQEYVREREQAQKAGKPHRKDLRLEALADILGGKIFVHSHCYRADEVLRLLETAEEFGIRVAGLHHVLEGYRTMPEIARHGSGTATFADWWAYKIEAYDAVPHNAGMLLRAGVNSTLKSDSADLMRHMNLEAAKCMRFSGLTPNEALRLITLNAARFFQLDDRIGSITSGKDGDVAIFDGHPLDTYSRCVMTLVEGEIYFHHRDFDPNSPPAPRLKVRTFPPPSGPAVARRDGGPLLTGTNGHAPAGTNGHAPTGYAIVNGTVHTVSGPRIERGRVIIADGKIVDVGADVAIPAGFEQIDASGMHVYPGLINASTQVGMREIGAADVTVDTSETGAYQPDLLAVSAFNPHSAMVAVTRAEGITTALLTPSAPTIAGQAGLVRLDGWTMPEMLIEPRVGLVVNLPSRPPRPLIDERRRDPFGDEPSEEMKRDERWLKDQKRLVRFFRDAKVYAASLRAAQAAQQPTPLPIDPRFDALVPYALGEKPVLFNANGYKAILETLAFAEQVGLRAVIVGGQDAWKLADVLAARKIPVIYEGVFSVPGENDAWDSNYRALAVLDKAGVKFGLKHGDASLAKLLPANAGMAIAHGLTPEAGLRAMTLSNAEILGLADRLGSLERGKVADVAVATDHPCQASAVVVRLFIAGKPVELRSQHTQHADQFSARPTPSLPPSRSDLRGPKTQTRPLPVTSSTK